MSTPALAPFGITLLRLSLATMWISHALLKLLVFTLPGFEQFLATHGMPTVIATPVVALELAGGIAIAFGYHGRWVSLALVPILVGPTSADWANGLGFRAPDRGRENPVLLIVLSVVHFLVGDGAFALSTRRARTTPAPARA